MPDLRACRSKPPVKSEKKQKASPAAPTDKDCLKLVEAAMTPRNEEAFLNLFSTESESRRLKNASPVPEKKDEAMAEEESISEAPSELFFHGEATIEQGKAEATASSVAAMEKDDQ